MSTTPYKNWKNWGKIIEQKVNNNNNNKRSNCPMFLYNMMSEIPIMSPHFQKCTKKKRNILILSHHYWWFLCYLFSFFPIQLQVKVPQHTLLSFSSVYNVYSFPKWLYFFLSKDPFFFFFFHTYNVEQPIVTSETTHSYHKTTWKLLSNLYVCSNYQKMYHFLNLHLTVIRLWCVAPSLDNFSLPRGECL